MNTDPKKPYSCHESSTTALTAADLIEELVSEALENFYERLDQVIGAVKEEYFARQGYQLQDPEEFDRHWAYGGIPYETTKEGNFLVQDKKGRRRYLTVVIYRMGSGRYELTSYISPAGRAGAGKPFERDPRAGMHGEAMEDDDKMKNSNTYWVVCNEVTEARKDAVETQLESFDTLKEAFAAADARGIEPSFYWDGKSWIAFWEAFKGQEDKYCSGIDIEDDDRKECIRCGDKFTDHSRDADADTCPDCLNADAADDAHNKQHDQD